MVRARPVEGNAFAGQMRGKLGEVFRRRAERPVRVRVVGIGSGAVGIADTVFRLDHFDELGADVIEYMRFPAARAIRRVRFMSSRKCWPNDRRGTSPWRLITSRNGG